MKIALFLTPVTSLVASRNLSSKKLGEDYCLGKETGLRHSPNVDPGLVVDFFNALHHQISGFSGHTPYANWQEILRGDAFLAEVTSGGEKHLRQKRLESYLDIPMHARFLSTTDSVKSITVLLDDGHHLSPSFGRSSVPWGSTPPPHL